MNKIRINLLPAEILEKRQGEKIISVLVLGVAGVFFAVFLGYLYLFQLVGGEADKLDALKADNSRYEQEIAKIADYESNQILVEQREKLVNAAIEKKYNWSKWLNNISLLIPNEVWIETLKVDAAGTVKLTGSAYADRTDRRLGQKSVAMWLVRLAELDDMADVWLESAAKSDGAPREPLPEQPLTSEELNKSDKMQFNIKAILTPLTEEGSVNSAPPTGGAT